MAKKLVLLGVFLTFLFLSPVRVLAVCNPPATYDSCQPSYFGTNGPQLIDAQYKPTTTDFSAMRTDANAVGLTNNRIPATIIVTDGTAANHETMLQILKNADTYGIDVTIRTWGNNPDPAVAAQMGSDFNAVISQAKKDGITPPARIEMGNEVNQFSGNGDGVSGVTYAKAFSQFVQNCVNCIVVLPSMGGPPAENANKNAFIQEFLKNVDQTVLRNIDGIVFNSYGNDAKTAATDWQNVLQMWKDAAGSKINFSNLDYYLTEVGPANPTLENGNVQTEMEAIAKQLQALSGTADFKQLKGASFFLWDKNENLILVTVDPVTGKITLKSAGKGNNIPGKIPLTGYPKNQKNKATCETPGHAWYPDESLAICPGDNCGGYDTSPMPIYTKADGSKVPEMRGDAGFVFNRPVQGLACGQARSDSFQIQESAPYDLFKKNTPDLCEGNSDSLHAWIGEMMTSNIHIPFTEPLAEHWAGKFDAEHYTEKEIEDIRLIARSNNPTVPAPQIKSSLPPPSDPFLVMASGPIGEIPVDKQNGEYFNGNAATDPQLNPQSGNRQWTQTNEARGLIECGYPEDQPPDSSRAPQLNTLAGSDPTKDFTKSYKLDNSNWAVSFQCMKANTTDVMAPQTGYDIGGGYNYLVLYADEHFITLGNSTMDEQNDPRTYDAVLPFYAMHISNINVDPAIIAAYQQANAAGRKSFPAIRMGDAIGQPQNGELCVSIRDSDDFMDPRSKLDWWNAYRDSPNAGVCKGGGKGSSKKKMTPQEAQKKIFQETGVLGKLLPRETQDQLKADFIRFIKSRPAKSLYQNFAIYGQSLVGMEDPPLQTDQAGLRSWAERNRKILDMMGLFPNEAAKGQVKVVVCGDREYQDVSMMPPYPETMKMGLAANQIFKILTPEETQVKFYKTLPRLDDPLTNISNNLLADATGNGENSQMPPIATTEPVAVVVKEKNIFEKLFDFLFAKTTEYANSVFAEGGCEAINQGIQIVSQDPFVYAVVVTKSACAESGYMGHIRLNAPFLQGGNPENKDYENSLRAQGIPTEGSHDFGLFDGQVQVFQSDNPALRGVLPPVTSQEDLDKWVFTIKADMLGDKYSDKGQPKFITSANKINVDLTTQPAAPPFGCDSKTACCITPTCAPKSFPNVQFGPPYTVSDAAKNGDLDLGVSFVPGVAGSGPGGSVIDGVKLIWKKEDWKDYSNKSSLPGDCTYLKPDPDNIAYCPSGMNKDCPGWGGSGGLACKGGICLPFTCAHPYARTVDIYSNVPYLYSMWEQVAGKANDYVGFLNYFKPEIQKTSNETIKKEEPASSGGNVGCFTDDARVFDQFGNFKPTPGAAKVGYDNFKLFHNDGYPKGIDVQFPGGTVGIQRNLLFYRIAGVCNADKWYSEKILNPVKKQ